MNQHAATFARYYDDNDDPWGFRTRWYERRKRALLLATLPREHFTHAWEMGCSNGELAAALAPRCARLLATDGEARAVKLARERLADFSGATVAQSWLPRDWPDGAFDLIILSEFAYYLSAPSLREVCRKLRASLTPDGIFVACHWRPEIADCELNGSGAHALFHEELPWRRTVHHLEADFILEMWAADGSSVAVREGLR